MHKINIARVTIADLEALHHLAKQTFYDAFADANTKSDMALYISTNLTSEKIADELNTIESEFYFAILEDKIVGYLKVNFGLAQNEMKRGASMEIERIYILKDYQNMKIGQVIFEFAMERAKSANVDFVWLGVWEKNTRAINFYKRNGFTDFDKHDFILGTDLQTDIMMRKSLRVI